MSKFFKEEPVTTFPLSEYLIKDKDEFKGCIFDEESRQRRTKYIMSILGDISLEKDTYELFMRQFQSFGGKYDVRTKKETIKGMYDISKRYPKLTSSALEEIWFTYIKDLFEEYALTDMLEKYLDIHGQTDDAIKAYLDFVETKAVEFEKTFKEASKELECYKEEYGERVVSHLQHIMQRQHISLEQIIASLPSSELIKKDQEQLSELSKKTRIYMGVCLPLSQQMIESLATGESLDYYPEQPSYVINGTSKVDATFTKQQFLDSVQKQQKTTEDASPKQLKKI